MPGQTEPSAAGVAAATVVGLSKASSGWSSTSAEHAPAGSVCAAEAKASLAIGPAPTVAPWVAGVRAPAAAVSVGAPTRVSR